MQMRRLCREAYLCQEKGREGDFRCLRSVAGEGYRWSIIVGGACLVQKLRKRMSGWGTVCLEQMACIGEKRWSVGILPSKPAQIHAKFDATFTHLDKNAQQDESTMGPHRITTASANALSVRCTFAYSSFCACMYVVTLVVGTNHGVSCFTIDRSESFGNGKTDHTSASRFSRTGQTKQRDLVLYENELTHAMMTP